MVIPNVLSEVALTPSRSIGGWHTGLLSLHVLNCFPCNRVLCCFKSILYFKSPLPCFGCGHIKARHVKVWFNELWLNGKPKTEFTVSFLFHLQLFSVFQQVSASSNGAETLWFCYVSQIWCVSPLGGRVDISVNNSLAWKLNVHRVPVNTKTFQASS